MTIQQHKKSTAVSILPHLQAQTRMNQHRENVTGGMKPFVTIANNPDTGGLQQRSKVTSPTHLQRVGPSLSSGACHEKQSRL
jgi:hypothetical protein